MLPGDHLAHQAVVLVRRFQGPRRPSAGAAGGLDPSWPDRWQREAGDPVVHPDLRMEIGRYLHEVDVEGGFRVAAPPLRLVQVLHASIEEVVLADHDVLTEVFAVLIDQELPHVARPRHLPRHHVRATATQAVRVGAVVRQLVADIKIVVHLLVAHDASPRGPAAPGLRGLEGGPLRKEWPQAASNYRLPTCNFRGTRLTLESGGSRP